MVLGYLSNSDVVVKVIVSMQQVFGRVFGRWRVGFVMMTSYVPGIEPPY